MNDAIETGILVAGETLSGTEWCVRQPDAWWDPDDPEDRFQLRPRAEKVDLICGHWTAGEAGTKTYADDGPRVVRVMKRRRSRKRDGRLRVSVQFVIGACDPEAEFAPVWQTMELGTRWAATHVGRGHINARSIGVEVVSAGLDGPPNLRDRKEVPVHLIGRTRRVLEFYPGQLRSWVRLADALSDSCLPGGLAIPRRVPVELIRGGPDFRPLSRRLRSSELRAHTGAMEHYLMDNTTKVDAGTLLLQALLDGGWRAATV